MLDKSINFYNNNIKAMNVSCSTCFDWSLYNCVTLIVINSATYSLIVRICIIGVMKTIGF